MVAARTTGTCPIFRNFRQQAFDFVELFPADCDELFSAPTH
jgi:hypothetical protein